MTTRNIKLAVSHALRDAHWFRDPGAYVLVDGQFGSTGKGLAAALLACYAAAHEDRRPDLITSNAGPNSGHTGIIHDPYNIGDLTWVNKQVPIATAVLDALGYPTRTFMNGGAVIDLETLEKEVAALSPTAAGRFFVHQHAAVVTRDDVARNEASLRQIASTGKGTGPAAAARMLRDGSGSIYADALVAIRMVRGVKNDECHLPECVGHEIVDPLHNRVFVETSQGLSLGINSGFYPYCTHRECSVAQAMADARISPHDLRAVMMVVRTYPIRVGNTEGSSGPTFPDQLETTWEAIGQTPEYTTVTKRMRRVFTWSRHQFRDGLMVNRPSTILLNFANYLPPEQLAARLVSIKEDCELVGGLGYRPLLLLGHGPRTSDVTVHSWF